MEEATPSAYIKNDRYNNITLEVYQPSVHATHRQQFISHPFTQHTVSNLPRAPADETLKCPPESESRQLLFWRTYILYTQHNTTIASPGFAAITRRMTELRQ